MSRQEIKIQFESGPEQLESVLSGLRDSALDLARDEEKWSIRQIVHHIADAEDLWKMCVKAAAGNPGCTFDMSWYILDNKWAEPLCYATRPIADAVQLFQASREHILELVQSLPEVWDNHLTLVHQSDNLGDHNFTVEQMIQWQTRHALLHIDQIRETRKVHGL